MHSDTIWNDVKCGTDLSLSNVRAQKSFLRLLFFLLYTILYYYNEIRESGSIVYLIKLLYKL